MPTNRKDSRSLQEKIAAESWRPRLANEKPLTTLDREIQRQEQALKDAEAMRLSPEARTLARLRETRRQQLEQEDLAVQQAEHLEKNAPTLNKLKALLEIYQGSPEIEQGMIVGVEQAIIQASTLGGDRDHTNAMVRGVLGAETERVERIKASVAEETAVLTAKLQNLRTIDVTDYHAAPQRVTLKSQTPAEQANELLQQLTDSSSFGFASVTEAFEAKRSLRDTGDDTLLKAAVSKYATVAAAEPEPQEANDANSNES